MLATLSLAPAPAASAGSVAFSAWCMPGEGAHYRYDRVGTRVRSDEWSRSDGSGFTGGAFVFEYAGGESVSLGGESLPIVARSGTVLTVVDSDSTREQVSVETCVIHLRSRRVLWMRAAAC